MVELSADETGMIVSFGDITEAGVLRLFAPGVEPETAICGHLLMWARPEENGGAGAPIDQSRSRSGEDA